MDAVRVQGLSQLVININSYDTTYNLLTTPSLPESLWREPRFSDD